MKLSVVTPSFNQASFIERTIASVVSQTGDFDLEYIIIDGGSTDGSIEIIKHYAEKDPRIQWVSEPDSGQSNAINKGLSQATGDIVSFLNSDDVYYPGTLQCAAKLFQDQTVQWAYGKCRIINEHDVETNKLITWYKNIVGYFYQYWLLLVVNYISQPATFWRRSVLTEIGLINEQEHLVMDYDYWCRLGQNYPARHIRQYLAGFRLYGTSKSGQRFVQQFQQEYAIAKQYTHSRLILWLHKIHTMLIVLVYKVIR